MNANHNGARAEVVHRPRDIPEREIENCMAAVAQKIALDSISTASVKFTRGKTDRKM
jgi:hypothetical protein